MAASDTSSVTLERALAIMRRPFAGPLLFGLVFGGVPFATFLVHLGLEDAWGDKFFDRLTPFAVLIAALGAVLCVNDKPGRLMRRALLASLAACVPLPIITWTALAWQSGFQILDVRNLPYIATLSVLWALVVTLLGWLVALLLRLLRNKHSGAMQSS